MSNQQLLERVVKEGWHALSGYMGHGCLPIASKNPNSSANYSKFVSSYFSPVAPLFSSNIRFKISYSGLDQYRYAKNVPDGSMHDSVAEYGIISSTTDIGLVKSFEVDQESEGPRPDPELVKQATKGFFGFGAKDAVYRQRPAEKIYKPALADAHGDISTQARNNERLIGMLLEFADSRWERGMATTQYYVVLRESDYRQFHGMIKNDPSLMLKLCFMTFPDYERAEGTKPFRPADKFIFAETPKALQILREQVLKR